jgi:Family of unknown function (DUF5677)
LQLSLGCFARPHVDARTSALEAATIDGTDVAALDLQDRPGLVGVWLAHASVASGGHGQCGGALGDLYVDECDDRTLALRDDPRGDDQRPDPAPAPACPSGKYEREAVIGGTMVPMDNVEIGDDEESAARAEQAIAMLVDAFEGLGAAGSVQALPGTANLFKAAFGWWASITRSSQAVLTLRRAGLEHEAAPIVRSIVQHSLVLQWMVEVGDDAINAVAEYGDNSTRLLLDTLAQAKWDLPDGFNPEVPRRPAIANPLVSKVKNFEELCISYGARQLYVTFRLLSAYAHPTATGALAYFDQGSGTPATRSTAPTRGNILQSAICLTQTGRVMSSLLQDSPLGQSLDQVDELLGAGFRPWPTPTH